MSYDAIVIGAGINGLAAATKLARGGLKVLVVEARDIVGGLASADEFHPDFRSPGVFLDTRWVRPNVISELGLEQHGLRVKRVASPTVCLDHDGGAMVLDGDRNATASNIAERSSHDAKKYIELLEFLDLVAPVLSSFFDMQPVNVVNIESEKKLQLLGRALDIRRLGRKTMLELLRLPAMPVADYLNEFFETPLLKAGLALPCLASTYTGPRSPGSCASFLLSTCAAGPGVEGAPSDVIAALRAAAESAGVKIRTSARVASIAVDGDTAAGVVLKDGEVLASKRVFSAVDPKTTLAEFLPAGALTHTTENRTDNFRCSGTTAHLLLAVDDELEFAAAPGVKHARIAASLDYLEQAFDCIKYRKPSENPALEVLLAPELAPAGKTVVAVKIHYVPYHVDGGFGEQSRQRLIDKVVDELSVHVPGLAGKMLAQRLMVPTDIETEFGLSGGHLYHGEHGLDQLLVRPMPECVAYRTPIDGLHLCSGGSHPGGWFSGSPGLLAARSVLV